MLKKDFIEKKGSIKIGKRSYVPIDYEDLNKKIWTDSWVAFIPKKITISDIINKIEDITGCGTVDIAVFNEKDKKFKHLETIKNEKEYIEGEKEGKIKIIKKIKNNIEDNAEYVVVDDIGRFDDDTPGSTTTYVPSIELSKKLIFSGIAIYFKEDFSYNENWYLWKINKN